MGGRTRGGCQPMNAKGLVTLNAKLLKSIPKYTYTKRQLKLLRNENTFVDSHLLRKYLLMIILNKEYY